MAIEFLSVLTEASEAHRNIMELVSPYTLLSKERIWAVINAANDICSNKKRSSQTLYNDYSNCMKNERKACPADLTDDQWQMIEPYFSRMCV